MDEQLIMLSRYPLLLPVNDDFTVYQGFIRAGDEEFAIGLQVPSYPSLKGLTLCSTWRLAYILRDFKNDLDECVDNCATLLQYLDTLLHLIESRLSSPEVQSLLTSGRRPSMESYTKVFRDLESVGQENVVGLSVSLSSVTLRAVDAARREHLLEVRLKGDSNDMAFSADLPLPALVKIQKSRSLAGAYQAFVEELDALQMFWSIVEELDDKCWIVDPENPRCSHMYRRINIATNVSVLVTIDPYNPTLRPDLKFLGSDKGITPFRKSVADTYQDWSPRSSFIYGLMDALALSEFPASPPPDASGGDQLVRPGECSICYLSRDEADRLTSEACDDQRCGCHYHQACLYEWLSGLPTNTTSFNRMYGQCPNCDNPISCPIST